MYWNWRRVLGPQGKLMAWNVEKGEKDKNNWWEVYKKEERKIKGMKKSEISGNLLEKIMKIAKEFCLERKEFIIKWEKWERVCAYIVR